MALRSLEHAGETVILATALSPSGSELLPDSGQAHLGSGPWRWVSAEADGAAGLATSASEPSLGSGRQDVRADRPHAIGPRQAEPAHPGWDAEVSGVTRFIFRVTDDGRFAVTIPRASPGSAPALATLAQTWNGRTWAEIAGIAGLSSDSAFAQALAGKATFTACPVWWPASGGHSALMLKLSGVPETGPARSSGFRGFGISHVIGDPADQDDALEPGRDAAPDIQAVGDRPPPIGSDLLEATDPTQAGKLALPAARGELDGALVERKPRLSPSERTAFQEIARALGVRPEGEPAAAEPSGPAMESPTDAAARPGPDPVFRDLEGQDPLDRDGSAPAGQPDPAFQPIDGATIPAVDAEVREAGRASAAGVPAKLGPDTMASLDRREPTLTEALQMSPVGALMTGRVGPVYANPALLAALGASRSDDIVVRAAEAGWVELGLEGFGGPVLRARSSPFGETGPVLHLVTGSEPDAQGGRHAELSASLADSRSRLQTELHRANGLDMALEIAADGVLILEADGRIAWANRAAQALFGYDARDFGGADLALLLAPESRDDVLARLEGVRRGGLAGLRPNGRETVGRVRQGGTVPLFMTLGRLEEGEAPRVVAVLRDLTPARRAEAELAEARERATEREAQERAELKAEAAEVLAALAREIRGPLSGMVGSAESLTEERFGPLGNERYKAAIRDIAQAGEQVLGMLGDVVDLSRLEAGLFELDLGSVALNDVLQQCVAIMQPQASRDRIIIRTSLAAGLPPVIADTRSIRQIALTLLTSSIRVTMPGGQVIVATSLSERGEVVLRLRDTGVGLSERELAGALDPLRSGGATLTATGTGLGLPLTRALVEANQASFSISSSKNAGTIVEIVFPAARVLGG